MNNQRPMLDPTMNQRLLSNLRRSRLDVAELDIKIDELLNKLEEYSSNQKTSRKPQLDPNT